jgi:hypothetical protein
LKINDLIVNDVDDEVGPEKITYASGSDYVVDNTIPNVGFNGDRFFRPMSVGELIPYTGSVLSIDPSGRGRDETSYAVVKMLNGQLFVPACNGLKGGYSDNTLKELAMIAARYDVNKVIVESNMGDGMFTELFKPLLRNVHPVSIEEVRHSKQKERRIIDTLEPVMNRHKLIFDPSVIKDDYRSALAYPIEQQTRYMLFYQLSRITKDKGSLMQDDRLDALAMAVAYWVEQMAQDADVKIDERKTDALKEELESFMTATVGGSKVKQTLWM